MIPYLLVLAGVGALAVVADQIAVATGTAQRRGYRASEAEGASVMPRRTLFDWAPAVVLILFLGTRTGVGTDYALYQTLYERLRPDAWGYHLRESPQEIGFTSLQLLAREADLDFHSFLTIIAAITIVPVVAGLRRLRLPMLGLVLYIVLGPYLAAFNVVRQMAAIGLLFFAVSCLPSRPRFAAWSIAAGLIHASAIPVALTLYAIRSVRPTVRLAVSLASLGVVAAGAFAGSSVLAGIIGSLNPRYEAYLVEDPSGLGTYLIAAAHLALVLVALWHRDVLDPVHQRFVVFAATGLVFIVLGTQSIVLGRLEMYFAIFLVPVYAELMRTGRLSPPLRTAIALSMFAFFLAYLVSFGDLIPYQSVWTGGRS